MVGNRKIITAIIDGTLYIDPTDVEKLNINVIKAKAEKVYKNKINVTVAPLNTWMPQTGTKAIMNEVAKELNIKPKKLWT